MNGSRYLLVVALLLSPCAGSAQDARPAHPLDALNGAELKLVKSILAAAGKLGYDAGKIETLKKQGII